MRAGGCSLQQGLTAEAASVVKQAVALARRRGHAQVTPLHVASTMLSASAGLLRTACLQSHSHPLQCKALELCFNVALNRLPASNSIPMLGHHHHHHHGHSQNPSISNALIAAFKRAQAHQRRGSIESQQQPLLAVKIELEQLIISILDDPSVSRVMREAGFSSTQVKSNVEQAVSLEICSVSTTTTSNNNNKSKESSGTSNNNSINNNNLLLLSHHHHHHQSYDHHAPMAPNGLKVGKAAAVSPDPVRSEDVMSVVECLVSKKQRGVVVVGECIDSIEGVVRGVMDKVEKEDVPEGLREVKFITLTLSSVGNYSRVEVDQKLGELKSLLRSCISKGVILYLGDLKWTNQYRANSTTSSSGDQIHQGRGYYCPVEHMVMEIGKLLCGIGENNNARFWVMGISTFQTYMRCKSGKLSLDTIWGIHPLTIPAGSLRLSLHTTQSELKSDESTSKTVATDQLNCCAECSAKFEAEAQTMQNPNTFNTSSSTSNLPAWLQQCKNEDKGLISSSNHDKNCVPVLSELCKKWNSYCYSIHHHPQQPNNNSFEKTLITFSSVSPSSSASGFSYDHHCHQNPNQSDWRDQNFWVTDHNPNRSFSAVINEPSLRLYFPENKENNPSIQATVLFSSNPNSTPTSASSSDIMEAEYSHKFKELNSENLKILCDALECKVPWQKDIIPEIASTILKCRSGMVRRKGKFDHAKEDTWFFFQGVDTKAKEKIAKELARLVFGSRDNFATIALSSFSSSTRADSTEDFGRNNGNCKRSRDEQSCSHVERFGEAVSFNPSRVFLVEDFDQADYFSQMKFKRAIESGRVTDSSGEEVELRDAIVILSCESFSSRSRACSPKRKLTMDEQYSKQDNDGPDAQVLEDTISPCLSLDLNISFDDCEENVGAQEDHSIDDIGLLECVDKRIVFKVQEL